MTRVDLLGLLVMVALLASLARPLAGNLGSTRALVCLDNLRRLSAAWLTYADDAGGRYVDNYGAAYLPKPGSAARPWACGWLDWETYPGNTNVAYLTQEPYSALAKYLREGPEVFRCPADNYVSSVQRSLGWVGRARSYSLCGSFGQGNEAFPFSGDFVKILKPGQLTRLSPQECFVFVDEHPDSMNDPAFGVPYGEWSLTDIPGSLHDGAGWLTFADGHLELHAWETPQLRKPVRFASNNMMELSKTNADLVWMRSHVQWK